MQARLRQNSHCCGSRRRGVSTVWIIAAGPALLVLLVMVTDIGNVWRARVELETALEAAALAAVKQWSGGPTLFARQVGVEYAAANVVHGNPVLLATNYDSSMTPTPNQNLSCDGNLVFGAITNSSSPYTFNAGVEPSCSPATVFVDVHKTNSGNATDPRMFGVFYDAGPAFLAIRSVSITIPILGNSLSQQPYFDATATPDAVVSISNVPSDQLNRFNTDVPAPGQLDYRGLDPDPVVAPDDWAAPAMPPPVVNPNGDMVFTYSDQVAFANTTNRFRTLTIHFKDGVFTTTNNPLTTDFVRFGASMNQLNPPAAPPGTQNDGDAFGQVGAAVSVTFLNTITMTTSTASATFIDTSTLGNLDDGRSEALLAGGGAGMPAVRAQGTVTVNSLWTQLFGVSFGPYSVSAKTTARNDCSIGRPQLIRIGTFICP